MRNTCIRAFAHNGAKEAYHIVPYEPTSAEKHDWSGPAHTPAPYQPLS